MQRAVGTLRRATFALDGVGADSFGSGLWELRRDAGTRPPTIGADGFSVRRSSVSSGVFDALAEDDTDDVAEADSDAVEEATAVDDEASVASSSEPHAASVTARAAVAANTAMRGERRVMVPTVANPDSPV